MSDKKAKHFQIRGSVWRPAPRFQDRYISRPVVRHDFFSLQGAPICALNGLGYLAKKSIGLLKEKGKL
jgi:hypothetical protein